MTEDTLIDWQQFEMIHAECAQEIGSIFGDFVAETPGQFAAMREALAREDAPGFSRLSHQWKGSSATFGMAAFAERLQEFERAAKEGRLPDAAALDGMHALFEASIAALHARHPELKTA